MSGCCKIKEQLWQPYHCYGMGLLNEITQIISRQLNVNIRKLDIETNDGIFEGKVQLYVHDVDDVKAICDNLRKIKNVKSVTRVEN